MLPCSVPSVAGKSFGLSCRRRLSGHLRSGSALYFLDAVTYIFAVQLQAVSCERREASCAPAAYVCCLIDTTARFRAHVLQNVDMHYDYHMQTALADMVDKGMQVFASDLRHWVSSSFDASMPPSSFSEFASVPVPQFEQLRSSKNTGIHLLSLVKCSAEGVSSGGGDSNGRGVVDEAPSGRRRRRRPTGPKGHTVCAGIPSRAGANGLRDSVCFPRSSLVKAAPPVAVVSGAAEGKVAAVAAVAEALTVVRLPSSCANGHVEVVNRDTGSTALCWGKPR